MKNLFIFLVAIFSAVAFAAPQWERSIAYPFLGNEFSTVPPSGGCSVETGCVKIQNWTGFWLSPGLPQISTARAGKALVVDAQGIVQGIYVGDYFAAGVFVDAMLGSMPAINGDFRPAIGPSTDAAVRPTVFLTVDAGVTQIEADAIQFRPDSTKPAIGFDIQTHRVVSYVPGKGTVVKKCVVYNDVTDPVGSPELAAFTNGSCH